MKCRGGNTGGVRGGDGEYNGVMGRGRGEMERILKKRGGGYGGGIKRMSAVYKLLLTGVGPLNEETWWKWIKGWVQSTLHDPQPLPSPGLPFYQYHREGDH